MRSSPIARVWGPGGARLLLGDAVIVALLVGVTAALYAPRGANGQPARAEVRSPAGVATVDLGRDGVQEIHGKIGVTRLEVRSRRLRVLSSPCPRELCRHGGWISRAGEMLVCLPNEVVVRLPGRGAGAPDALSR